MATTLDRIVHRFVVRHPHQKAYCLSTMFVGRTHAYRMKNPAMLGLSLAQLLERQKLYYAVVHHRPLWLTFKKNTFANPALSRFSLQPAHPLPANFPRSVTLRGFLVGTTPFTNHYPHPDQLAVTFEDRQGLQRLVQEWAQRHYPHLVVEDVQRHVGIATIVRVSGPLSLIKKAQYHPYQPKLWRAFYTQPTAERFFLVHHQHSIAPKLPTILGIPPQHVREDATGIVITHRLSRRQLLVLDLVRTVFPEERIRLITPRKDTSSWPNAVSSS